MLLQLIGSTHYFMGSIYKDYFFYLMKGGETTKAMIRSVELGTY